MEPLTAVHTRFAQRMDPPRSALPSRSLAAASVFCTARWPRRGPALPVIVIGDDPARLETAKKMGADITINIKEVDGPGRGSPKRITGGVGVDYVIEAVGSHQATYEQAFKMLRREAAR